ncbi:type VI secretion system baseplate subunit TssF [Pelistega indica]|nr:type VI secretion system baseplate subunit TssF [Pelistega indica]
MSNKFIEYYHQELVYMHEMAREFAENYPKVANRLSMGFSDNSDPYVERLLQGLSFLTAPIHMKMDAEFPQFTHHYLEKLCPEYIAVAPSMGLVQFQINNKKGNLNEGVDIPRGLSLRARLPHDEEVLFTTSQAVKLWPLEVTSAKTVSDNLNVIFAKYPVLKNKKIKQAITVQLNLTGSVRLNELSKLENLDVYINGDTDLASLILEAILGHTVSILYQDAEGPSCWSNLLGKDYIEQGGISKDVSLFPLSDTMHIGHRLAYEYFLLPEKFRFIQLKGLRKALKIPKERQEKSGLSTIKITFFLDKKFVELEGALDKNNFLLFCTPIVNLFRQDIKNIFLEQLTPHYPLVADTSRPNHMEIFSVTKVEGVSEDKYKTRIDIPNLATYRQGNREGYTTQRNTYTFGVEKKTRL